MVTIQRADSGDLLAAVVAKLDRGDAPDSKYPDGDGEYSALCPFHTDTHVGNFSVSARGYKCFSCDAKGGLRVLAEKLGVASVASVPGGMNTPPLGLTLAEFAAAKRLPLDKLRGWGLEDMRFIDHPVVKTPYYDRQGLLASIRYRHTMLKRKPDKRFTWRRGDKIMPYGLWQLEDFRKTGHVVLCEGESDSYTFWVHDVPAIGVPGASNWKAEYAKLFTGLTVYVWHEPDQGGDTLLSKVGVSLPDVKIITPPTGIKDPSELHMLDRWGEFAGLLESAKPYSEIRKLSTDKDAAQALADAGDLATRPDILTAFARAVNSHGLVGEDRNAQLLYLCLTSRLLARPVSLVMKGPSAGGKSYSVETVLRFMPKDAYMDFTSLSEHALIYDQRPLAHKFIVIYELAGLSDESLATALIRSLLSEGCLKYVTVQKGENGLEPVIIERPGPTGLISTTTMTSWHPENETRYFSLLARDDAAQTRAVFGALADRWDGHHAPPSDLAPWLALQAWVQSTGPWEVHIPYARQLAEHTMTKAVRMRRDFGAVLSLIASHALLHRATRATDSDGRIIATLADYVAVHGLIADILALGVEASVSASTREIVQVVADLAQAVGRPVTVTQVATHLGADKSVISRRVGVATRGGWLVNQEDKRGKPARLVKGEPLPDELEVLPSPDKVRGDGVSTTPCALATLATLATPGASGGNGDGHDADEIEVMPSPEQAALLPLPIEEF